MLSSPALFPGSMARAAGRRRRTYAALTLVAVAAITAVAVFRLHPVEHDFSGLLLAGIGVLVMISLVSGRTPLVDGAFNPQWSLDGLRTVPARPETQPTTSNERVEYDVIVAPSAVLIADRRHYSAAATGDAAALLGDLQATDRAAARFRSFIRTETEQPETTVIPVLIVSGPGAPELATGHRIDNGVHVVDGTHPELWMHLFNKPQLSSEYRHELYERIARPSLTSQVKILPTLSPSARPLAIG